MPPEFRLEQEVRFAVVMYGGVSLAIYINGVAQELFRLVRATAPAHQYAQSEDVSLKDRAFYPDDQLDGTERVYRRLGQMLGLDAKAPGGDAIRTRFVVDIISGTSAGGINGVLLGLALAQQKDFRESADLWRKVADIDVLLREKKSYDGLPPATPTNSESLLNGYRLYFKARDAMDDMPAESPDDPWRPAFVEQLDLAVTATDLDGAPLPVRLTEHRSIDERVHRKVFRFSYGTPATIGEYSDFEGLDLMLGFAARATSSFPFAFEPVLLRDVATLTREGKPHDPPVPAERFFSDDLRRHRNPEAIAFADGGYLDNKPFSYATEALRTRRADVPVSRKLIYIEPHPIKEGAERPQPTDKRGHPRARPDVIANIAASVTLPRHETIREDVAAVAQRNIVVQRLQELGLQAERALDSLDPLSELRVDQTLSDDEADTAVGAAGPAYAAYRTLRVRAVLDDLAALGTKLRGAQLGDDEPEAERDIEREVRNALRAWVEAQPANGHGAFLARFDASYQQRRLSFLHDRVNDLLRGGSRAARMVAVANTLEIAGAPAIPDPAAALRAPGDVALPAAVKATLGAEADRLRRLKQALNIAVDGLRRAERAPNATLLENVLNDATERAKFADLVTAAHALPDDASAYMDTVEAFLEHPLAAANANIEQAIRDGAVDDEKIELSPWLRTLLGIYDERFEAYDMVVLPLAYPSLGETNAVDIVRISPLDATSITPKDKTIKDDPPRKLAGIRVSHFGGFLDAGWRDNDLMWGRLDAAEVIIDTLVGDDHPERDALRVEAQAAILRQDLRDDARKAFVKHLGGEELEDVPDKELVDSFRDWFTEPAKLGTSKVDDLTARSLRIGSKVFSDAAYGRKWPTLPLQAASLAGPLVARVALPASRGWQRVKAAPKAIAERVKKLWPFGG